MASKRCSECGQDKSVDDFYRHPRMASGRLNKCKTCVCERVRTHRRMNDSVREYDRERAKKPHRVEGAELVFGHDVLVVK